MNTNTPQPDEALLPQRVRESGTLEDRVQECIDRVSTMCSETRGPRMSIPVQWSDDDFFITETLLNVLTHLRTPAPAPVGQWRHKKGGGIYTVIGHAMMQTTYPLGDDAHVVIYRGEDGRLWTRAYDEFHDGRFTELPHPPEKPR